MTAISINIDDEEKKVLEKRAKKNFLSLKEQVEDIVRRSAIRGSKQTGSNDKIDDKLVAAFSRDARGRKHKRKKRRR